jgi:hypothetical protein
VRRAGNRRIVVFPSGERDRARSVRFESPGKPASLTHERTLGGGSKARSVVKMRARPRTARRNAPIRRLSRGWRATHDEQWRRWTAPGVGVMPRSEVRDADSRGGRADRCGALRRGDAPGDEPGGQRRVRGLYGLWRREQVLDVVGAGSQFRAAPSPTPARFSRTGPPRGWSATGRRRVRFAARSSGVW